MDYWSYCVLTPTLKSNCDFTLAFAQFAILPLTFEWEASVYPGIDSVSYIKDLESLKV